MTDPRGNLAIVIPTRNRPQALAGCLAALAEQELERLGRVVIVNDGGCSIATVPIPAALADRVQRLDIASQGSARARNTALATITEPLIAFLDDDAAPAPGWLAACVSLFDRFAKVTAQLGRILWSRKPGVGWCAGLAEVVPRQRQRLYDKRDRIYRDLGRREPSLTDLPGVALHLSGGNAAIRRSFLQQYGLLDERYRTFHDRELAWRILATGGLIAYNPDMTVHHDHDPSWLRALRRCVQAVPYELRLGRQYPELARQLRPVGSFSRGVSAPGSLEACWERLLACVHRAATLSWLTLEMLGLWRLPHDHRPSPCR